MPDGTVIPNSKVIALNTNVAYLDNYWILGEKRDPGNHLAWLEAELASIEKAGGLAYIIGHVMPQQQAEQSGGRYRALMERYQHIIRMEMFGHTHDTWYNVVNSMSSPDKHIGVQQVGPSATTWNEGNLENPGYAVITIDSETLLPLNFQIYALDIKSANALNETAWELTTDYIQDYELTDISPDQLYKLAERMKIDGNLASLFEWDRTRKANEVQRCDE